jgi:hypothetical protein
MENLIKVIQHAHNWLKMLLIPPLQLFTVSVIKKNTKRPCDNELRAMYSTYVKNVITSCSGCPFCRKLREVFR